MLGIKKSTNVNDELLVHIILELFSFIGGEKSNKNQING